MRDEDELVSRGDMTVYHNGWGDVARNGRRPNYPTLSRERVKQEEI